MLGILWQQTAAAAPRSMFKAGGRQKNGTSHFCPLQRKQKLSQDSLANFLYLRGTWVAQSVKSPTLDFGSGHDVRLRSMLGSTFSMESTRASLLPLPPPLLLPLLMHAHVLSFSL